MDYKDYVFNRKKTEEMLKKLRKRFFGYDMPLSAYVCEKRGGPSDEKIENLADTLMKIMLRYNINYKYYGIDGATVRFLKLYLYLTVRAYGEEDKTFGDLLENLRDMAQRYDSLEQLILRETGWQPAAGKGEDWDEEWDDDYGAYTRYPMLPEGFFAELDTSCRMLTGRRVGDELTDEELQQIWNRQEERNRRREEERGGGEELREKYAGQALASLFPGDPDYNLDVETLYGLEPFEYQAQMPVEEDPGLEGYGGEEDDFPSDYQLLAEEKEAAERERIQREEKWKKSISDPEKFLEAYREFRSLFFHIEMGRLCDALEEAVVCFLCEEEKSGLADNETFLQMYIQLDKIYRRAGKR